MHSNRKIEKQRLQRGQPPAGLAGWLCHSRSSRTVPPPSPPHLPPSLQLLLLNFLPPARRTGAGGEKTRSSHGAFSDCCPQRSARPADSATAASREHPTPATDTPRPLRPLQPSNHLPLLPPPPQRFSGFPLLHPFLPPPHTNLPSPSAVRSPTAITNPPGPAPKPPAPTTGSRLTPPARQLARLSQNRGPRRDRRPPSAPRPCPRP